MPPIQLEFEWALDVVKCFGCDTFIENGPSPYCSKKCRKRAARVRYRARHPEQVRACSRRGSRRYQQRLRQTRPLKTRGRKRHVGVRRDKGGRILDRPKYPCSCGGLRHRYAKSCRACEIKTRRELPDRQCKVCGGTFRPQGSKQTLCSRACAGQLASVRQRRPETPQRLRDRRRRTCRARRDRGYRKDPGRWRRICDRDGYVCWLCGFAIDPNVPCRHPLSGTADHVIPLVDGGADDDSNLRPAHLHCNVRRGKCRQLGALSLGPPPHLR